MFVTEDSSLHKKVLALSNHGRVEGQTKQFWPDLLGYKYKMANIQAAIGCAQIERIEKLVTRKRNIFHNYRQLLEGLPITMNPEPANCTNGYWMPTVVFEKNSGITREMLLAAFLHENIDARVFFYPLSGLPMFGGSARNRFASEIASRAINLPSHHDLTDDDQVRVSKVLCRLTQKYHV